ncbi:hypothetical protein ACFLYQ_01110 [Chloroflexota bacterium]
MNIGTLNEKLLHKALKQWYAESNDLFEVSIDGFVVDIVRGDLLIEIQTRNFRAIKRKLERLLVNHRVRLVYPIPFEKWIIKRPKDEDGPVSRRKSPKRGGFEHVFDELVSFPQLLINPNFSLELLLIQEEEVRRYDGTHGWRRRAWVTFERRLLKVIEQRILLSPADMSVFIPSELDDSFTTADFAASIAKSRRFAQKMVYCLRLMGCITPVGKRANSILYARLNDSVT